VHPPLGLLARAYECDVEIRRKILAHANPLPLILRSEIADAALGQNSRPAFERVLANYDLEQDGKLKITASIYHHRAISRRNGHQHVKGLLEALHAVGPDLHERRAAAFAGMLVLGRVNDIAPMQEYADKPLNIRSGTGYGRESDSLMALMCERWEELRQTFGTELAARFGDFGSTDTYLWDSLAPHVSASSAARRDFIVYCKGTSDILGIRSLVALARELPSSELLLKHCLSALEADVASWNERSPWDVQRTLFEVAYVIREHFRERLDVRQRVERSSQRGSSSDLFVLALVDPNNRLLDELDLKPAEIGRQISNWVLAIHVASCRSGSEEFVKVVLSMLNRKWHDIWDFQEVTNRAVVERFRRDPDALQRAKATLANCPTESEIASIPRYMAAAGAFDQDVHELCRSLLQQEVSRAFPRAGYDAFTDTTQAVSKSLLEVLVPSYAQ
jgi:hypothetical protein